MRCGHLCWHAILILACCGCTPPAQVLWSPDGRRAAYWSNVSKESYILDDRGRVLERLGPGLAGFAWSPDSAALYFSAQAPDDAEFPEPEELGRWRAPSPLNGLRRFDLDLDLGPKSRASPYVLKAFRGGRVETLLATRRFIAYALDASPDGKWLAISALVEVEDPPPGDGADDDGAADNDEPKTSECYHLFVLSLHTRRLFLVSDACFLNACWTGPARLAWWQIEKLRFDAEGDAVSLRLALAEATLDEGRRRLRRSALTRMDIGKDDLAGLPRWVASVGEDVLMLLGDPDSDDGSTLSRYRRAGRRTEVVARGLGGSLSVSPGGRHALVQRQSAERCDLALLSLADGSIRPLMEITGLPGDVPVWPTWQSGEEFTFVRPLHAAEIKGRERVPFDLVLYRLTPDGRGCEPVRTLSEGWPEEMRPHSVRSGPAPVPATQPATRPADER